MDLVMPMITLSGRQHGFTFVELAVVLAVVGLMTWATASAFGSSNQLRDRDRAVQLGETLRQAVRVFALVNARLPCPDTDGDGDGWEGGAAGVCDDADQAGWLPYRSLGLDVPDDRFRAAYAVYRRPDATLAQDADSVKRKERTGDIAGDPHFQDARDLVKALNNAGGDALSAIRTRLTGNDGGEGAVNCVTNVRSHPAFFIVLPLDDHDANGNRFDGPHAAGVACAWTPGTGVTHDRDDVVIAEPLAALAGWLGARAP